MGRLGSLVRAHLYKNDTELLYNPQKKDQDWFIAQGVFNNVILILAYGTFLSGFAVHIGASDLMVGYLVLIPSICGVVSFFSSFFWRRLRRRKPVIILLNTLGRSIVCLSVPVSLLLPEGARVPFFTAALTVSSLIIATITVAVNSWFVSVIPEPIRGRYLAVRQFLCTLPAVALPPLFGRMLDAFPSKPAAFYVIFGTAFLMMLLTNRSYARISEAPAAGQGGEGGKTRILDLLRAPFRNRSFIRFEAGSAALYFAIHSSFVFSNAYMIRYLEISYQFITLAAALLTLVQLVVYRYVGQLCDRYGHRLFYKISIFLYAVELGIWALTTPETYPYMLILRSVVSGCSNATFIVSVFNYRYQIMRLDERDVCEGFHTTVTGIVLFAAPAAGRAMNAWIRRTPALGAIPFGQFRILYMLSTVMLFALASGMFIIDALKRRREAGQARHGGLR